MDAVSRLICFVVTVIWVVLLIRVIVSLLQAFAGLRPPMSGPLRAGYELLFDVTEPPLRLLRRIVPPVGMIDISVLAAFVIVTVAQAAFCV